MAGQNSVQLFDLASLVHMENISGNQLMVFDEQMVILNKRFALKLYLRHCLSPFVRSIFFYENSYRMPNSKGIYWPETCADFL
jgi:hypothetical protein